MEMDPVHCMECSRLEADLAPIKTVARHFNSAHSEYVKTLKTALALAAAQSIGEDYHRG